jgi:hypothetical protein
VLVMRIIIAALLALALSGCDTIGYGLQLSGCWPVSYYGYCWR